MANELDSFREVLMYKLTEYGVIRLADKSSIPSDPLNADWQEYLRWSLEGNTPEPADPEPVPSYRDLRAAEYPDFRNFLDGMVKVHSSDPAAQAEGDAQVSAYCDACIAVKEKYPKP